MAKADDFPKPNVSFSSHLNQAHTRATSTAPASTSPLQWSATVSTLPARRPPWLHGGQDGRVRHGDDGLSLWPLRREEQLLNLGSRSSPRGQNPCRGRSPYRAYCGGRALWNSRREGRRGGAPRSTSPCGFSSKGPGGRTGRPPLR